MPSEVTSCTSSCGPTGYKRSLVILLLCTLSCGPTGYKCNCTIGVVQYMYIHVTNSLAPFSKYPQHATFFRETCHKKTIIIHASVNIILNKHNKSGRRQTLNTFSLVHTLGIKQNLWGPKKKQQLMAMAR